jgi:predicted RNase H-like nuclease (RuvC/YqgF family)
MDNKKSVSIIAIAMLLMLVGGLSICIGAIAGLSNKVSNLQNELKNANNQVQAKEVESNQYTNSEIDTKFDLVNTQIENKILKVNEELKKLQDDKKDDKKIDLIGEYKVLKVTDFNEKDINKSSLQIKEDGTIIVCGLRWGMTASSGRFPHCITFAKK